ncbi:MAG TPA: PilZ domain-containing protein [Terriglobia bacterium]|nr:PilZ domain-containing protein [Terriglobia bacterium]
MAERRQTERIFFQIPIVVQGVDHQGKPFSEQTTTIEVNRDGARIGLKSSPRLGAEMRVSNLATRFSALFRVVVQCPQSYGGSPEWGIALSQPMPDLMSEFWGIAFEELKTPMEAHIAAPLLCKLCGRQELVRISEPEYAVLLKTFVLPRVCPVCRQLTDWEPCPAAGSKPGAAWILPESKVEPAAPGARGEPEASQRRAARRVAVRVPIQIKTAEGRSEETISHDVSRTGLSFATQLDLAAGDAISVIVGYGIVTAPATQEAWVVWRRPAESGVKAIVGVRFAKAGDIQDATLDNREMSLTS